MKGICKRCGRDTLRKGIIICDDCVRKEVAENSGEDPPETEATLS